MSQEEMDVTSPASGEDQMMRGGVSGVGSEAGGDIPPGSNRDPMMTAEMADEKPINSTAMARRQGGGGCLGSTGRCLRKNLQTILILTGLFLGIIVGLIMKYSKENWSHREKMYVGFVGDIFVSMLRGITVPLVMTSLVSAVGKIDIRLMGRIGGRAMTYYMISTLLAVLLGMALVFSIKPGTYGNKSKVDNEREASLTEDVILDMIRQLFPPNIVAAFFQSYKTVLKPTTPEGGEAEIHPEPMTTLSPSQMEDVFRTWEVHHVYRDDLNIMGLIVFSVCLAIALAKLGEKGKMVVAWADGVSEATMKITNWIIWFSPFGIFCLLAKGVLELQEFTKEAKAICLYIGTCIVGFFIHSVIILPALYLIFVRKLPFKFIWNVFPALLMALSTASSLATLPMTIKCLETRNKMDRRVTRFVLPIGANINMDGMALYEAVAVVFIAQLEDGDLSIGRVIALCIIATVASVGASGVPEAGIVMTLLVLGAVGLPIRYISYIILADPILDRFATMVNVFGDCIATGVVSKWTLKHLQKFDLDQATAAASKEKVTDDSDDEDDRKGGGTIAGNKVNSVENNAQNDESLSAVKVTNPSNNVEEDNKEETYSGPLSPV